ncbi:hypothetical protein [Streptomyces sp. 1331.2]|uniref:hypothetical protein n=1 Tax=Streptomyces sp. 1331.2 TaxID=1938835 RepID=UPI00117D8337|nr:hypothetical protein [Streptomyces sp. 1331.2]
MPATDEPEAVVSRLWQESRNEPWPKQLNWAEPAGVDLATLDVRLSGCIHTWLFHRDSFGTRHVNTVRALLRDLELALPELTEEDNPRIWQRYHQMAKLISDNSPHSAN